jgi:hypothetical protein
MYWQVRKTQVIPRYNAYLNTFPERLININNGLRMAQHNDYNHNFYTDEMLLTRQAGGREWERKRIILLPCR